ncbi:MAG: hypothetical protein QOG55_3724 [Acidobacteriaceae bacterium]|jgi:hypothetical protein|nr:hypothetical protein [Acidobacteriaceae bacterium]
MNHLFQVLTLVFAATFLGAGAASADTLQFTLAGPVSASFELSSGPLSINPVDTSDGFGFRIMPANLVVNGASSGDFLAFFNEAFAGGFGIFASGTEMIAYATGPQIYGGTELNPTFAPGVFTLDDSVTGTPVPGAYTLTVTDLTTVSTPEPSVTVLLAIGLLAVGLALLRFKPNLSVSAS